MPRFTLTYNQKQWIRKNRLKIGVNTMARKVGCARDTIRRFMQTEGIALTKKQRYALVSKQLRARTTATPKEDQFLTENYLSIPVKAMAAKLGRAGTFVNTRLKQLGLKIPRKLIEERKRSARYKPGTVPINKGKKQSEFMSREAIKRTVATRFKKGQQPHNTKYDGAMGIREHALRNGTRVPYKVIRIAKGKWKMFHVYKWEKKYGPVPDGYIIVFRNKNTMDCSLKNLKKITRPEHMLNNSIHRYPPELKQLIRLNNKLKRKIEDAKQNI